MDSGYWFVCLVVSTTCGFVGVEQAREAWHNYNEASWFHAILPGILATVNLTVSTIIWWMIP